MGLVEVRIHCGLALTFFKLLLQLLDKPALYDNKQAEANQDNRYDDKNKIWATSLIYVINFAPFPLSHINWLIQGAHIIYQACLCSCCSLSWIRRQTRVGAVSGIQRSIFYHELLEAVSISKETGCWLPIIIDIPLVKGSNLLCPACQIDDPLCVWCRIVNEPEGPVGWHGVDTVRYLCIHLVVLWDSLGIIVESFKVIGLQVNAELQSLNEMDLNSDFSIQRGVCVNDRFAVLWRQLHVRFTNEDLVLKWAAKTLMLEVVGIQIAVLLWAYKFLVAFLGKSFRAVWILVHTCSSIGIQ